MTLEIPVQLLIGLCSRTSEGICYLREYAKTLLFLATHHQSRRTFWKTGVFGVLKTMSEMNVKPDHDTLTDWFLPVSTHRTDTETSR
ncbi:hypothetical protein LSTR_LSTR008059 [Laodelphax striatellus]|uniref:Uncharacterized protein n=1 Tax=Laodelphax striatellus TaxID=195883 RepID=A0A482XM91_LAOST|nr:hypothetical protein LSTR_LSTR008059 [Laodelphax striatellus]